MSGKKGKGPIEGLRKDQQGQLVMKGKRRKGKLKMGSGKKFRTQSLGATGQHRDTTPGRKEILQPAGKLPGGKELPPFRKGHQIVPGGQMSFQDPSLLFRSSRSLGEKGFEVEIRTKALSIKIQPLPDEGITQGAGSQ